MKHTWGLHDHGHVWRHDNGMSHCKRCLTGDSVLPEELRARAFEVVRYCASAQQHLFLPKDCDIDSCWGLPRSKS
jgi:hypothetical protein